jgi:hypothetical protein
VHEKRRDYACPHCAAAFGEAGNLTRHVRTVHRQGERSGDEESFTAVFAFGTSRKPDKTIIAICRFTFGACGGIAQAPR